MMANKSNKKIRMIFFSFGILEQGGGFEDFMIQTAPGLVSFDNIFDATIVTSTPKITEKLQKLLSIYFLKKHSLDSIYRESREDIERRLDQVRYVHASNLSELVGILNTYDFVYVKNEILELLVLKMIKKRLKTKVIIGVHTPIHYPYTPSLSAKLHNFLYTGKFYGWLLRDASQIKVNNADDEKYVIDTYNLHNVHVVHQAFDVTTGHQITNTSKQLRVLFVGRITEQKGIDIILSAIHKLIKDKSIDNFDFKIAGSGEAKLEASINELSGKYSNIEYLGHVEHLQVEKLYDWTDITVIPSKYETLNKIAVETAVAAKVAVSSDIPGPREVINNKVTGYLIPTDANEFYYKLKELAKMKEQNPKKLLTIGRAAQQKIIDEFAPAVVYKDFHKQLLNG